MDKSEFIAWVLETSNGERKEMIQKVKEKIKSIESLVEKGEGYLEHANSKLKSCEQANTLVENKRKELELRHQQREEAIKNIHQHSQEVNDYLHASLMIESLTSENDALKKELTALNHCYRKIFNEIHKANENVSFFKNLLQNLKLVSSFESEIIEQNERLTRNTYVQ